MSTWDAEILNDEVNTEFLDELLDYDDNDIIEAIRDACLLVQKQPNPTEDERLNGLAAATIAAIWNGAPFSAGEIAEDYPFIRDLAGSGDEELNEVAAELLESTDTELDIDQFIEALS